MFSRRFLGLLTAGVWFMVPLLAESVSGSRATRPTPPKFMLWSWFAEDDLRFLKDSDIGVAYLALSLWFEGSDKVVPGPRSEPLRIAPNTWQMVVVRFDFNPNRQPAFSEAQRRLAVKMIAEIAALSGAQAIQIDFDAPASAHSFYRHLLTDVRNRLGPKVFLSITALVSWCETRQSWLAGLPVDEIVPMAFYMGQATPAITTMLQRGGQFSFPGCHESIGVQLGYGTPVRPHKEQRAYFFAEPQRWSAETVRAARAAVLP